MSLTNIEMAMLDALTLARSRKTGSESSLLLFCMVETTITLRTVMIIDNDDLYIMMMRGGDGHRNKSLSEKNDFFCM